MLAHGVRYPNGKLAVGGLTVILQDPGFTAGVGELPKHGERAVNSGVRTGVWHKCPLVGQLGLTSEAESPSGRAVVNLEAERLVPAPVSVRQCGASSFSAAVIAALTAPRALASHGTAAGRAADQGLLFFSGRA